MSSVSFLGSLSQYESYDSTTQIGTRFPTPALQIRDLLKAPNGDEQIKDLATLVSQRGVVFLTNQDIDINDQKELIMRMGTLTGVKPKSSTLHKHPIHEAAPELGEDATVISNKVGVGIAGLDKRKRGSHGWHTDITFEKVPSDYTMLKVHTLPSTGGDTLWASGYAAYDKLSPAYQKFLEGLTATHSGEVFLRYAERSGVPLQRMRGSPENDGEELVAVHPVVRTHPVTGYKSLFVNRGFTIRINELAPDESDALLDYLFRHVSENHDFQVRYKWNKNDVAIWDNRCTFHTATHDYEDLRLGDRVVGIGEKPYLDPASKSRKVDLGL